MMLIPKMMYWVSSPMGPQTHCEEQYKDLQNKHCTTAYDNKFNTKQERECSVLYEK